MYHSWEGEEGRARGLSHIKSFCEKQICRLVFFSVTFFRLTFFILPALYFIHTGKNTVMEKKYDKCL